MPKKKKDKQHKPKTDDPAISRVSYMRRRIITVDLLADVETMREVDDGHPDPLPGQEVGRSSD